MKIETYYDISCSICGKHYSTDYEHGMEQSKVMLRKSAKATGWIYDRDVQGNICPQCKCMGYVKEEMQNHEQD